MNWTTSPRVDAYIVVYGITLLFLQEATLFISIDRHSTTSIQEQLYEQVRQQILDGRLKLGAAMPSSRSLALQQKISRNSVMFAYEKLINEGYIITRPMVGTYVTTHHPERLMLTALDEEPDARAPHKLPPATFSGRPHSILNSGRIPIDFWPQRTDPRTFPLKAWRRHILHSLATAAYNLTEYGDPCGLMSLRSAIAEHVAATRNIHVSAEQVVMVAGAQLGLNLVLRVLAREGDSILVENPCNQGAAYLFESLNLKPLPIEVDRYGINPEKLQAVDTKLCFVMPSHQYPMGGTLTLKRRMNLARWAEKTGAYIIEDDYDNEFYYDGSSIPAIAALSPDNTIYLGTFSKSLGAGLRVGYAIFPSHLVSAANAAKALLDNGQVWLEQAALSDFLKSGGFMRHLRRIRMRYMLRRNALVSALKFYFPNSEMRGVEAGTHLAWRIPEKFGSAHRVMSVAHSRNIGVYTVQSGGGHEYDNVGFDDRWLLLGYASLTEEQIEAGIARLADIVK